jgi:hypothetical protein
MSQLFAELKLSRRARLQRSRAVWRRGMPSLVVVLALLSIDPANRSEVHARRSWASSAR